MKSLLRWVATACLFSLLSLFSVCGAEPDRPAAAAPLSSSRPAVDELPLERSIYIPYEKLWKVFEKDGRGVFLPYEEFQELWESARRSRARPVQPQKPAVSYVLNSVAGEIRVTGDVIDVTATLSIELLTRGWHKVPIYLGDVALTSARLGDAPARILRDDPTGYSLLVEKTNSVPETLELSLAFAKTYTKSPGSNSVSFECPPAPVSRWDIRIPETGVRVDIRPLLARTEAPPEGDAGETHIVAFIGSAPTVRLEWTPKAEGARGLKALVGVQTEERVTIEEGIVRTRAQLLYDISRTELSRVCVDVPADHKVVNVFDPNVREWSVAARDGEQRVTAELFEPTKGTQALIVELEQLTTTNNVRVPVVAAVDVGRQQGVIAVQVSPALRVEPTQRAGLLQLDIAELPESLRAGRWDFAYRYASVPHTLRLSVETVEPRVLVDALVEVHVTPEELTANLACVYAVERAGVFGFDVVVPDGYDVRQVRGSDIGGAAPVSVDSYHLGEPVGGTRLLRVNLAGKAKGRVGLEVALRRALDEPELLMPSANAVALAMPLPRVGTAYVARVSGRLAVYGPESLRLTPKTQHGLRPIAYEEAMAGMRGTKPSRERPVLSFAYADESAALTLDVQRRAPHCTVRQLLLVSVESGVVKYESTFFYDIRYSGIKALRLDIPRAIEATVRVTTPGVMHAVDTGDEAGEAAAGEAAAGGATADCVSWRLTRDTEFFGEATVKLSWESKIDALELGGSAVVVVPRLIPRAVDRAWGQVVVAKAESIDIVPAEPRKGLRPIDPRQDLMPGGRVESAAQAYEFHQDWALSLKATRYEARDVKSSSVERGLVRMVLTRGEVTSVQALYRMRSVRQRLVVRLPGDVHFDTQPLRINGRAVSLEQGEPGEYFVPLVGQEQNEAFLLELRYTVTGMGRMLRGPEFPNEPAIQQVYLSVYYPRELAYLGRTGPWTDELVWVLRGFSTWPRANRNSDELLGWVAAGIEVDRAELATFAVDGRHVLYSTLRPVTGDEGALRLRLISDTAVKVVTILLGLVLGLALLNASFARRAVAVGLASIALVAAAVFVPSLARAVISNATAAAGFTVLVLWGLWYLLVTRPRIQVEHARRQDEERARLEAEIRAATAAPPPVPEDTPQPDGVSPEGGEGNA